LVAAFVEARLLVAQAEGEGIGVVRVAHEALFSEWRRARETIDENAQLLKIKQRIEAALERARAIDPAVAAIPKGGLLTGFDLADALRLKAAFASDLPAPLGSFIEISQVQDHRKKRLSLILVTSVAALMAVLFVAASVMFGIAHRNETTLRRALSHQSEFAVDVHGVGLNEYRESNFSNADSIFRYNIDNYEFILKNDPNDVKIMTNLAIEYLALARTLGPSQRAGRH